MANMKEYTIKVNGVEQSAKNVDKLNDSLEKVDVKVHDMSVSAKDVASAYKDNFQEVVEYIVLQMSKVGAIITELNAHLGQAAEKNKEAGEKLAQDIEKSAESSMSVIKVKAIEASATIEAWINKVGNRTDEQSAKLAKQVEENKKLLDTSLETIEKKYEEGDKKVKDIGLESYKKYVAELKKHKEELDAAILHTSLQYDTMSMHYDKDSAEFKKAQEDKKKALEELQKKVVEVNTKIKDSSLFFLDEWNKRSDQAVKDTIEKTKNVSDAMKKMTKMTDWDAKTDGKTYDSDFRKIYDNITSISKPLEDLHTKQTNLYKKELAYIDERSTKKKTELDKEIKELEKEAKEKKKELGVDELNYEKKIADGNVSRYESKIKELEERYKLQKNEKYNPNDEGSDMYKNPEGWEGMSKEDQKEIENAKTVLDGLNKEKDNEATAATEKAKKIAEANDIIFDSEEKILKQKQELETKKAEIDRKSLEEKGKLQEKIDKREEQAAKIKRIKDKAEHVIKIAQATSDVAKGVASTWGTYGPILGPVLAALVAVNGAIQLGIMAQQLKYMENGGLLNGKRHAQGGMRIEGTNIEVEGGEYVVNRVSTDKNIGLIRYINSQRRELTPADVSAFFSKSSQGFEPPFSRAFEVGVQLPVIDNPTTVDNEYIVEAIRSIRIEPRVSVTDINRVQGDMVSVDGWVGL